MRSQRAGASSWKRPGRPRGTGGQECTFLQRTRPSPPAATSCRAWWDSQETRVRRPGVDGQYRTEVAVPKESIRGRGGCQSSDRPWGVSSCRPDTGLAWATVTPLPGPQLDSSSQRPLLQAPSTHCADATEVNMKRRLCHRPPSLSCTSPRPPQGGTVWSGPACPSRPPRTRCLPAYLSITTEPSLSHAHVPEMPCMSSSPAPSRSSPTFQPRRALTATLGRPGASSTCPLPGPCSPVGLSPPPHLAPCQVCEESRTGLVE